MPEYLAPGVYVEETSFRAKTIEGVSTSTAGFVGPTRFGPVGGVPELITSFARFEQVFGSLDQLQYNPDSFLTPNFLAQGVRTFFENGGARVYVTRIYTEVEATPTEPFPGHASTTILDSLSMPAEGIITLRARHPGKGGEVQVTFSLRLGQTVTAERADGAASYRVLQGVNSWELVENRTGQGEKIKPGTGPLYWVKRRFDETKNGVTWDLFDGTTGTGTITDGAFRGVNIDDFPATGGTQPDFRVLTVTAEVSYRGPSPRVGAGRADVFENLTFHPKHARSLQKIFGSNPSNREQALTVPLVFSSISGPGSSTPGDMTAIEVAQVMHRQPLREAEGQAWQFTAVLRNGRDGQRPQATAYVGVESADPNKRTGLRALETILDISIVAAPGHTYLPPELDLTAQQPLGVQALSVAGALIGHCERMKYRVAVLDSINQAAIPDVRKFRAQIDSTRAALYYPWVRVIDPVTEVETDLPPSGFVTGIYARNDIDFGVHKSPANEVVRGALGFEKMVGKAEQDVLNPEGINCFRYFEGRGYRLWGARTVTSDPEWKYLNVRRYFAFLERSVDVNTQWVVFENNGPLLWAKVRRTVEDFLFNEWKSGHLLGEKPEQAYFVKCDLTTMTQNDLDNGRLICLVGVSPLRPAEFVIFRVGQKTLAAQTV